MEAPVTYQVDLILSLDGGQVVRPGTKKPLFVKKLPRPKMSVK